MTTTGASNEQAVRRLLEGAFSTGDVSIVDEVVDANLIEHQRGARSGAENLKQMIVGLRTWFPDLTLAIEDLVVQDDKVWARCVARGTQIGPMMGRPPTGDPSK
jgi:predicted ester cyclase